ncbi:MAG: AMP-binding protein [Saprospiraceae bacterium]|nr:AMP-binding protein [Saprospiraceae bacterium]
MNVFNHFAKSAKAHPARVAIQTTGESIHFGVFETDVRKTAAYLIKKGIKPGDRVLVFVPMSIELYKVVLAIFQVGATAVFLDEWVSLTRLRLCCQIAGCKAFVGPWKFRILAFFIPEIRSIPIWLGLNKTNETPLDWVYPAQPDDTALLTFTTGSTGTPKAARRSHAFLNSQFDALIEEIQPQTGDVVMTNLPIVMLVNFGTGATSVIAPFQAKKPAQSNPEQIAGLIKSAGVNVLIASPFLALRISEVGKIENLEKVFTGGGPVYPDDATTLTAAFPKAQVSIVYGSTEAEPVSTIDARQLADLKLENGLCVGKPVDRISLKILPIIFGPLTETSLSQSKIAGEIGEIVVAGDHVLSAYWNNDQAFLDNKIVDAGGRIWHRTGDAGFLDETGRLFLCGRCKHMVFSNGAWFSPFVVEGMLRTLPGIKTGTLMVLDQKLTIVAEKENEADADLLGQQIFNVLPFQPASVKWIAHLPRDPRHFTKIDYEKLVVMLYSKSGQ